MKKVMSLVMVLVCFAAMAGCGTDKQTGGEVKYKPGTFTKEDFALINTEKNVTFTLGMTKEEVESVLGKEVEVVNNRNYVYSDGIYIIYRNDKIVSLSIDNVDEDKYDLPYKTVRGIQLYDTKKKVQEVYGEFDCKYGGTYYLNEETGKSYMEKLPDFKPEWAKGDLTKTYIIDMRNIKGDEETNITQITISDGENCWNHK